MSGSLRRTGSLAKAQHRYQVQSNLSQNGYFTRFCFFTAWKMNLDTLKRIHSNRPHEWQTHSNSHQIITPGNTFLEVNHPLQHETHLLTWLGRGSWVCGETWALWWSAGEPCWEWIDTSSAQPDWWALLQTVDKEDYKLAWSLENATKSQETRLLKSLTSTDCSYSATLHS